jgi:hypothetical protein
MDFFVALLIPVIEEPDMTIFRRDVVATHALATV